MIKKHQKRCISKAYTLYGDHLEKNKEKPLKIGEKWLKWSKKA
jgi:hypothetical protein